MSILKDKQHMNKKVQVKNKDYEINEMHPCEQTSKKDQANNMIEQHLDDSPKESCHALLKKETLYNNNISSLKEYIQLVEDWIIFYNTIRIKGKKNKREKLIQKEKSESYFSLFNVLVFLMSTILGSHH